MIRPEKFFLVLLLAISCSRTWDGNRLATEGNWDAIIENYRDCPDSVNVNELCLLNVALAEKGMLADEAFHYTQAFSLGLFPEWERDYEKGALLARILYSAGHVSLAQRYAFEAMICADGAFDSGMMELLVNTNIIYGAYDVAEKYISRLEKDRATRDWASSRRRFLHDDAAVAADPEYGPLRACIPDRDFIDSVRGIDEDLKDIIRTNPCYGKTISYLGIKYLLDCDFDSFRAMLDEFYGTEALPVLPYHFQEAVCMMSELDRGYWKTVGADPKVYRKFTEFAKRLETGLGMEKYKDSYWYYVMRVNTIQAAGRE